MLVVIADVHGNNVQCAIITVRFLRAPRKVVQLPHLRMRSQNGFCAAGMRFARRCTGEIDSLRDACVHRRRHFSEPLRPIPRARCANGCSDIIPGAAEPR